MKEVIITLIILIICWIICNYLVKKYLLTYQEVNEVIENTIKTRKIIFFDIIFLLFANFMKVNFITWIGMIYYFCISFLMLGVLFLSILEILMPGTDNKRNKDLWRLFLVNMINISTKFLIAVVLVNFVYIK